MSRTPGKTAFAAAPAVEEIMDVDRGDEAGDGAVADRFRCCDACIAYAAAIWDGGDVGINGCVDCERISAGSK